MNKKIITSNRSKYKDSLVYRELNYEGKEALDTVMSILEIAHIMKKNQDISPAEYLKAYSPDNPALKNNTEISWPQALHALITDVFHGNDLLSQSYLAGRKH